MPMIDDDKTDGSSFNWTIQNFHCCFHKFGEALPSPIFVLKTNSDDKWRLLLYPKGATNPDFIGLELLRLTEIAQSKTEVHYALSIRTTTGLFKKESNNKSIFSPNHKNFGSPELLNMQELRKKGTEAYLDDNTITVRCRVWRIDDKLLAFGQCYARTIINMEMTTNIWSFENIRKLLSSNEIAAEEHPISSENPSLAVNSILSVGNSLVRDGIKVVIKRIGTKKPSFSTCVITLLESAGDKIVSSIEEEYWFDASDIPNVWTPAFFPMSKIYDCKKPYLRCELTFSSAVAYSNIERVENGNAYGYQPSFCNQHKNPEFADSWKDDLQRLYLDGKFSDFTVCSPRKEFPVHKAILCARSAVFCAMFEQDMTENLNGIVKIEDIDDDIIYLMLLYIYTNTLENLNCEVASKLYFAADKYGIMALRKKCSSFLQENLSVLNCCDVLVLANMHQDQDLESFVQDFILDHAAEVMGSTEWENFMQEQLQLASTIMHVLCKRNLKICPI